MRPISFTHFRLAASASVVIWAAVACGDSIGLPPATIPNWVDTMTLAAIQNTPIPDASALDILTARETRTDQGQPFDLLFDRGYITFDEDGSIVVSDRIDREELARCHLPMNDGYSVGDFNAEQQPSSPHDPHSAQYMSSISNSLLVFLFLL